MYMGNQHTENWWKEKQRSRKTEGGAKQVRVWVGDLEVSRRLLWNHNPPFEGFNNEAGVSNNILLCNIHVPPHPLMAFFCKTVEKSLRVFLLDSFYYE